VGTYVDTSRFTLKNNRVKRAFAREAPKVLLMSAQEVFERSIKNLSGPGIKPGVRGVDDPRIGKSPVPRRTGTLARAQTLTPLSPVQFAIWTDPKKANYGKYVHDGTKKMKPRRYLSDVVRERGPAIQNRIRDALLKAIRSEGRR